MQIFPPPAGDGVLGWVFPFQCFHQGRRFSLGCNSHRCPVTSAHPQSSLCLAFSTLCSCAGLAPINHFSLHLFDQSMRYTEWEQIMPTIRPLFWSGGWASEFPTQWASVPLLKKVSVGAIAALSQSFHTLQLSVKSSLSQSWPVTTHLFYQFQVPQVSPPRLSGTVPAVDRCPSVGVPPAVCMCAVFSLATLCVQVLLTWVCDLPTLGEKGCARLLSLTWLSSNVTVTASFWWNVWGLAPLVCKTISPPILKHILHTLASILQIS